MSTVEDVESAMKLATCANLIGENIIDLAMKKGWITKENVRKIAGVPHSQIYYF